MNRYWAIQVLVIDPNLWKEEVFWKCSLLQFRAPKIASTIYYLAFEMSIRREKTLEYSELFV